MFLKHFWGEALKSNLRHVGKLESSGDVALAKWGRLDQPNTGTAFKAVRVLLVEMLVNDYKFGGKLTFVGSKDLIQECHSLVFWSFCVCFFLRK